jgi:hypothetical protein
MPEVNQRLKVYNLWIDYVKIQSELKYLIGAEVVRLKCWGFGGKTGLNAMVWGFGVVKLVARVWCRSQP